MAFVYIFAHSIMLRRKRRGIQPIETGLSLGSENSIS
jgi:hypothetical protein